MTGTRERGERWRGGRSRRMEEGVGAGGGAGGGGESSRPSSFRASVTGLVRRVSQKVTRENKGMTRLAGLERLDVDQANVQTQYGGEEVAEADPGVAGNPLRGAGLNPT